MWTLGALGALAFPALSALTTGDRKRRAEGLARYLLALAFLAHEAALVVDAVTRVIVRMAVTRKHLLEWTSAEHTAFGLGRRLPRAVLWREMYASPLLALGVTALVAWIRPSALPVAAPFLAVWLLAPEIALWVGRPPLVRAEALRAGDRRKLRRLARRTWLFFETFVGPGDQWLPIDNHQAEPHEQTAHRTSPTNIGMMLLSTLSAYDLGYVGPSELSLRLRSAFDTHRSAHPLPGPPAQLVRDEESPAAPPALRVHGGQRQLRRVPLGPRAGMQGGGPRAGASYGGLGGLSDTLDVLQEVMDSTLGPAKGALGPEVERIRRALEHGRDNPRDAYATIRTLCDDTSAQLDHELIGLLDTGAYRHEPETLHALRTWMDTFHQQLQQVRREIDMLLPWLALQDEPANPTKELPLAPLLHEIPDACLSRLTEVDGWEAELRERGELSADLEESARRVREALRGAATTAQTLRNDLLDVVKRAESEALGMDFRLLFDGERKLFHIGYNVTLDQVDPHHYDLLASEARLASYLAIVKHEVPESHWYALGRPMTRIAGSSALLSWGGRCSSTSCRAC